MAGILIRKDWEVLESYFAFKELSAAPATPEGDTLRVYAKDNGTGTSTLCYKNDGGSEVCLPTSGSVVTGAGVVNRLAYWDSASSINDVPRTFTAGSVLFAGTDFLPQEDNSNLFWDDTTNRLGVGTATPGYPLETFGDVGFSYTAGQTYVFTRRSGDLRLLDVQSQSSGAPFQMEWFTKDGDGTDSIGLNVFAKGTPADVTNRELFQFYYDTAIPDWKIVSDAGGTGTIRRIQLFTGANVGQLVLNTDGTVDVLSVLDAGTGFQIAGGATSGNILRGDGTNFVSSAQSGIDHGSLGGLTDDDHTQYALLAGRSGGQTLIGGTAASNPLTLRSTSNATKGVVAIGDDGSHVTIGGSAAASELRFLEPSAGGTSYTGFKAPALAANVVYTLPTADGTASQVLSTDGAGALSWVTGGGGGFDIGKHIAIPQIAYRL